jgi:hypothetical protein
MILARNSITLHHLRDITAVVWYYKLQASTASAPTKPTAATPSGWTTTEPSYTEGSTNSLYVCQKTTFSDGSFEYSDVSLSSSYEAAKAAYNKSVQAKEAADTAQEDIDNLEVGGRNLLKSTPLSHNATAYGAYSLIVTEPLEAGQVYTIQLWDVNVSHSAKTAEQLGVNVYYCGSSVTFGKWIGTDYFTDGHADHLTLTFTPTTENINHSHVTGATTKHIRLYNSVPNASGTRNMSVGKWKLEKGNRATDWTPAPEDVETDINEAKKTANNYLSADNTGIMVADMTDGNQYTPSTVPSGTKNTFIDEESFQVRDGTDVLASFGATSMIGKATEAHLEQTPTGSKIVSADGNDSVMMGAETSTPKSISETYSSDDAEITITLSPDIVEACTITLTINSTSYTMTQGATYRHIGSAYTIDYDGEYEIIVGNTLSALLSISVTYTAMIASGYGVSVDVVNDSARVRVKTTDEDGNIISGMLGATKYGSFGLYDDRTGKWIIRSDANGNVFLPYKSIRPQIIYNTKKQVPTTQNSYVYANVSKLSNYNMIGVRVDCAGIRQIVTALRLFGDNPMNVANYNGSDYVRAQLLVDWTNNRIGIRWVNGNSAYAGEIFFQQVYGIL